VGYRYFTVAEAQSRDLVGWVRNLESGEVEVWAEGPRPELERLLQALRQGPHLSRVESVTATWGAATGKHKRFSAISTAW
jgi:acylphosphatase